jgi:hypothetical protein
MIGYFPEFDEYFVPLERVIRGENALSLENRSSMSFSPLYNLRICYSLLFLEILNISAECPIALH